MNVYNKYLNFSKNPEEEESLFEDIIADLKPIIEYNKKIVSKNDKEDYVQELYLKLLNIFRKQRFKLDLFDEESKLNRQIKFKNERDQSLLGDFIARSEENTIIYNNSKKTFVDFNICLKELELFIGNIKFINYIIKVSKNFALDFLRKEKRRKYTLNDDFVNKQSEKENLSHHKRSKLDIFFKLFDRVNQKDKDFLRNFISDFGLLTQKEVAAKLNCSPQAVSKRYKRIVNKIILEKEDK